VQCCVNDRYGYFSLFVCAFLLALENTMKVNNYERRIVFKFDIGIGSLFLFLFLVIDGFSS
jgi:hypothetical protein